MSNTRAFNISSRSSGVNLGTYRGDTTREAIGAYVAEAGYATIYDAAEVLGQTTNEFCADLVVTGAD